MTLTSEKNVIQLTLIESETLYYFCANAGKLVTRDDLMNNVWDGRIVTENAVNRVVAKLRKSLGDDSKNSDFIQTIPRKGYRLIALVEIPNQSKLSAKPFKSLVALTTVPTFCAILLTAVYFYYEETHSKLLQNVTALTRDIGLEREPEMSPNGEFLTYTSIKEDSSSAYIKQLDSGERLLVSNPKGNTKSPSWSHDNNKIVYFFYIDSSCQIRIAEFESGKITKEKIVHNCPFNSRGQVAFAHNNESLLYSERLNENSPYYLYQMSLIDGSKKKLAQPTPFNAGHLSFDLHPKLNKLLLSTPNEQQLMGFYELDLNLNKFTHLFDKEDYTCCAIWAEDGETIVSMGPFPASNIVEMDLNGENVRSLFDAPFNIGPPQKVNGEKSYIFSGGHTSININYYSLSNLKVVPVTKTSVNDKLPTVNSDATMMAYISDQTGISQVWIKNIASGIAKKLTDFKDHSKYFDIQFSPNNQRISLLSTNAIKIVDVNSGLATQLKLPQQTIRGISWAGNDSLSFSIKVNDKWLVHDYALETDSLQISEKDWAYIKHGSSSADTVTINYNGELFNQGVKVDIETFNVMDHNRAFNFQLQNGILYFRPMAPDSWDIYTYKLDNKEMKFLLSSNIDGDFSIATNGLYYTNLTTSSADIYKVN